MTASRFRSLDHASRSQQIRLFRDEHSFALRFAGHRVFHPCHALGRPPHCFAGTNWVCGLRLPYQRLAVPFLAAASAVATHPAGAPLSLGALRLLAAFCSGLVSGCLLCATALAQSSALIFHPHAVAGAQVFTPKSANDYGRKQPRRMYSAMSLLYPALHHQPQRLRSIAPLPSRCSSWRRYSVARGRSLPAGFQESLQQIRAICLRNAADGHSASSTHAESVHLLYRPIPAKHYGH